MAENKIDPKFNIHSNYTKVNILNPYRYSNKNEVLNFMAAVGIANDDTVYYPGTPQEITGNGFYIALDTFVNSLKAEGIFSKLKAVYPLIGGTADRHKWNLINPQDSDDAFRISFYGSGIHSKTGFKGDGSTAYGDTHLNQITHSELNNESYGFYLRSQTVSGNAMGLNDTFILPELVSKVYARSQVGTYGIYSTPDKTSGFTEVSRTLSSSFKIQRNSGIYTADINSNTILDMTFYIGCRNSNNNPQANSNGEYSYFFIGEGLTESEMTAHHNAVQQLQTDLGRAV
jgi:hypothetical protein